MKSVALQSMRFLSDMYFRSTQRLSILIYHRVLEAPDFMRPDEPTTVEFDWQMSLLAKHFNPLSMSEALGLLEEGALPPRAVCVTFDDGYADNAVCALPILERWGIPATVFVASGFLDGGRMWNDTIIEAVRDIRSDTLDLSSVGLDRYSLHSEADRFSAASQILNKAKYLPLAGRERILGHLETLELDLPNDLMLTGDQLLQLASSGVEIGAHTKNHPIMATLSLEEASEELSGNRSELESRICRKVRYFAYPNGQPEKDYKVEHRNLVHSMGFESAFSTVPGVADSSTDRFQLPRFTPWDRTPERFMARLLLNQKQLIS